MLALALSSLALAARPAPALPAESRPAAPAVARIALAELAPATFEQLWLHSELVAIATVERIETIARTREERRPDGAPAASAGEAADRGWRAQPDFQVAITRVEQLWKGAPVERACFLARPRLSDGARAQLGERLLLFLEPGSPLADEPASLRERARAQLGGLALHALAGAGVGRFALERAEPAELVHTESAGPNFLPNPGELDSLRPLAGLRRGVLPAAELLRFAQALSRQWQGKQPLHPFTHAPALAAIVSSWPIANEGTPGDAARVELALFADGEGAELYWSADPSGAGGWPARPHGASGSSETSAPQRAFRRARIDRTTRQAFERAAQSQHFLPLRLASAELGFSDTPLDHVVLDLREQTLCIAVPAGRAARPSGPGAPAILRAMELRELLWALVAGAGEPVAGLEFALAR